MRSLTLKLNSPPQSENMTQYNTRNNWQTFYTRWNMGQQSTIKWLTQTFYTRWNMGQQSTIKWLTQTFYTRWNMGQQSTIKWLTQTFFLLLFSSVVFSLQTCTSKHVNLWCETALPGDHYWKLCVCFAHAQVDHRCCKNQPPGFFCVNNLIVSSMLITMTLIEIVHRPSFTRNFILHCRGFSSYRINKQGSELTR